MNWWKNMNELIEAFKLRKKIEPVKHQRRVIYDPDTGKFDHSDIIVVEENEITDRPYVVVSHAEHINPITQRVKDNKLVNINSTVTRYWFNCSGKLANDNIYFCIGEINNE